MTDRRALWRSPLSLLAIILVCAEAGWAAPRINEFLASNRLGLVDEDGEYSDWIELHNPDPQPVSLAGYRLTGDPRHEGGWTFPDVTLAPGAYLVVFASGKNRADPGGRWHTDFRLSTEGEYLGLIAPDGRTVVSEFAPAYPPQFEDVSFGLGAGGGAWSFFATPTPGAANGAGNRAGPVVAPTTPNPSAPEAGPLTITAEVRPTNDPVQGVRLYYRRMFANEIAVAMKDDGTGGDAVAGDGTWTAAIPADAFAPGEMTRWRFVATDVRGTETLDPPYRDPLDSDRYYGTVTRDPRIQSLLPVFHWFTPNPGGAGSLTGSRGSVYYLGELYDNVLFTLHGQSSAGFPKKSYNLDFSRTHRFLWSTNASRVADIDLLTNWADKAKARHVLGYEVMRESGVATHFAFTVRVQQNGAFFSTADFVEDADEIYLARAGLNPAGALYKVYANQLNKDLGNTGTSGVEKKTRKEEKNTDLQALIDGLDLTGTALVRYLYDHIDIPACVNMLAANSVIRNIDMHSKNWYAYCDTGRSGEWAILPWDLDLSFGRVWNTQNTYFDNALYTDDYVITGTAIRLVEQLFANPATRAMLFRRIRTLSDRFLQPPPAEGTPESALYCERRLNEISALIDPPTIAPSDAQLDFEKWGSWLQGGAVVRYTNTSPAVESMAEAVQRFKKEYLPARRRYIYETQVVGRGGEIPLSQNQSAAVTNFTPLVVAGAPVRAVVPLSSSLGLIWTGDPAREPFAATGWLTGTTGVGYERASGYETLIGLNVDTPMQANNSVYLRIEFTVTDPAAYNRLQLRLKYDDGFVAFLNGVQVAAANAPTNLSWNSAATISHEANPAAFVLFDLSDKVGALRPGRNILAIQGLNDAVSSSDMIIVPELHAGRYVPAAITEPRLAFGTIEVNPASGNQDEEFIQLVNPTAIAVDISDWKITGGVEHRFAPGTVLPAGGSLYLSPNVAAFRARKVSPTGGEGRFVQGGYRGHLANAGETLTLLDATGATNNAVTYPAQLSPAQRHLVPAEILFHPASDERAEFIELLNTSDSVTLDLRGVRFTKGVQFDFTGAAVTSLPPGGRVLVVRDRAVFTATFGAGLPIAGVFTNGTALANGGETLKLEDAESSTIFEFTYDDQPPWPVGTDSGFSLVLVAPATHPDPSLPASWRASARVGGTPGGSDEVPYPAHPTGDDNHNGVPDLMDYVLGNDLGRPPVPIRALWQPDSLGAASLVLTYPMSVGADRATIRVLASTDLRTWHDAGPELEALSTESLGDGRSVVTWRVLPPLRDEARFFLRLQAVPR